MSDLRRRREMQTRTEMVEAAIALFTEHGVDDVTMTHIAAEAGVSRRTAYRYFSDKEDVIFELPRRWLDQLHETLDTRGADEPLRALIRRSVMSVAQLIESDRHRVSAAFSLVVSAPSLVARHAATNALWTRHYTEVVAAELAEQSSTGAPSELDLLRSGVIAGALVGGTDAALAVWIGQSDPDLLALTEAALDQIDGMWAAAGL